jgi:hypothetical protein
MVLALPLQAEPLLAQQVTHRVRGDLMALGGQLGRQRPGRFGRPPQRRHRIPRSCGSIRASSAGRSPGSASAARLRPPPGRRTRPSGSAPESSSVTPSDTVASRTPAARATSRIPPCPQRLGLSAHQQPPLPLIQMRQDRLELRRQHLLSNLNHAHTTSGCRIPGSYGLFPGALLARSQSAVSAAIALISRSAPGTARPATRAAVTSGGAPAPREVRARRRTARRATASPR